MMDGFNFMFILNTKDNRIENFMIKSISTLVRKNINFPVLDYKINCLFSIYLTQNKFLVFDENCVFKEINYDLNKVLNNMMNIIIIIGDDHDYYEDCLIEIQNRFLIKENSIKYVILLGKINYKIKTNYRNVIKNNGELIECTHPMDLNIILNMIVESVQESFGKKRTLFEIQKVFLDKFSQYNLWIN